MNSSSSNSGSSDDYAYNDDGNGRPADLSVFDPNTDKQYPESSGIAV